MSERVPLDEYVTNLTMMITEALGADMHVILLEPTPHARPVTDGPRDVTLENINNLTHQYGTAMRKVAQEMGVEFVSLFDEFLRIERLLAGDASLYADEVHLNARGDTLYSQLVYQYLDAH